jgi:hypothetical protein
MSWFERLTGFREESPQQVREQLEVDGDTMVSRANGRVMKFGTLETPTLGELRERVGSSQAPAGRLRLREVVGDVGLLHVDPENVRAMFQVASQFNLLEMVGPHVVPETGVGIYEHDHTQGPTCAIAAGSGTIYRNYFVPIGDQIGQSADRQIDCLADVGRVLGNENERLWQMKNGYAQATSEEGLTEISYRIRSSSDKEVDSIRQALRIGCHRNVEVTLGESGHTVSQAYCSALPLGGYSLYGSDLWEPFARLVLEAAYEATMCAAVLNAVETGNDTVYLTLLGGGVFGNDLSWIIEAIERAIEIHQDAPLDVAVVSYGRSNPAVTEMIERHQLIK